MKNKAQARNPPEINIFFLSEKPLKKYMDNGNRPTPTTADSFENSETRKLT